MTKRTKANKRICQTIKKCKLEVGPHKGYWGLAEYDNGWYEGQLIGLNDVVTFAGKTPEEAAQAFVDSVDDYLDYCSRIGHTPDKAFSGTLTLRMSKDLHRQIAAKAQAQNVSINTLLTNLASAGVAN